MTATTEQMNFKDAKVVQTLKDNKFSLLMKDELLYLFNSTVCTNQSVIASINVKCDCTLYCRDLANLFVSEMTNDYEVEALPDEKIKQIISNIIEPYTVELLKFKLYSENDTTIDNCDFMKVISKFESPEDQCKLFESLCDMKVYSMPGTFYIPIAIAYTQLQSNYLEDKMYSFCKINSTRNKYATCSRTETGKYIIHGKNGTVGKIKGYFSDNQDALTIFFEQRPQKSCDTDKIRKQVELDVVGSSYVAANRYIKLQTAYESLIQEQIERIQRIKGVIDISTINYPDLEVYAEQIAKLIRKHKNSKDAIVKDNILKELTVVYSNAEEEIEKAKITVEHLKKIV